MNQPRFAIAKRRRVAVVAGATGLVGRALVEALLNDTSVGDVHALVRSERSEWRKRNGLTQHVVDYNASSFGLIGLAPLDDAFCCLGTTLKVAGSREAFRAVDFDAALNFARAARDAGATRLGLVSALGADPGSSMFYNRVKGELEKAVTTLGYSSVLIARPSFLLGDRSALGQPERTGERIAATVSARLGRWIPRSVRPIRADVVARGLLAAVQQCDQGVYPVPSHELQILGA